MVGFSVSAMKAMLEKSGCLKVDVPAVKGESKGAGKQE
jgi:hypothetical protein